jgi:hypothetical protein
MGSPFYDEGMYDDVEIIAQGFMKSSTKGTPGFFLTISPGEYDRNITWYLPDGKEDAVERLLAGLESLGLPLDKLERFTQLDPRSTSHVSFVGYKVTVKCSYDKQSGGGKVYERWEAPYTPGNAPAELDQASIRKLDALFGKKLKSRPKAPPPVATAKAEKAERLSKPAREVTQDVIDKNSPPEEFPAKATNDDIPFAWFLPFLLVIGSGLLSMA